MLWRVHASLFYQIPELPIQKFYQIPAIVVATKADKIARGKWNKHESIVKKALEFDKSDAFVLFSSETKMGKEEAWKAIELYLELEND